MEIKIVTIFLDHIDVINPAGAMQQRFTCEVGICRDERVI